MDKTGTVRVTHHWRAFVKPLLPWKSNEYYIVWVCVCRLRHPACKAYASYYIVNCGPGCVATGYGLDGPGIESRWGAGFSAPVQTGPGAHPASCTMGTGSFAGVKSGRSVTLTPHTFLVPWWWKGRAIPLLPPMGSTVCTEPHCLYQGAFYLFLPCGLSGSSYSYASHNWQEFRKKVFFKWMGVMIFSTTFKYFSY